MTKGVRIRTGLRISDVGYCDKDFERVLFVWLADASFDFTFNFCFSLFAVTVVEENILYQLGEVRGNVNGSIHLLNPSSFLKHHSTDGRADTRAWESK